MKTNNVQAHSTQTTQAREARTSLAQRYSKTSIKNGSATNKKESYKNYILKELTSNPLIKTWYNKPVYHLATENFIACKISWQPVNIFQTHAGINNQNDEKNIFHRQMCPSKAIMGADFDRSAYFTKFPRIQQFEREAHHSPPNISTHAQQLPR